MSSLHRLHDVDHPIYGSVKVFDELDTISRTVLQHHEWEPEIAVRMANAVIPGTDVLDVGANMGFSTLGLLCHGAKPHLVHCFEPQPDVHAVLQHNTRKAPVRTYNFGLSSGFGLYSYSQIVDNIGGTQLRPKLAERMVAATSLDEILRRDAFVQPVSVMKIDVEAHEHHLLVGAVDFFKIHRPIIFIEIMDHMVPMVSNKLETFGYRRKEHLWGWDYIFAPNEVTP